jgi:hypothetical protein
VAAAVNNFGLAEKVDEILPPIELDANMSPASAMSSEQPEMSIAAAAAAAAGVGRAALAADDLGAGRAYWPALGWSGLVAKRKLVKHAGFNRKLQLAKLNCAAWPLHCAQSQSRS